jgi:hypothetical protein
MEQKYQVTKEEQERITGRADPEIRYQTQRAQRRISHEQIPGNQLL